MTSGNANLALLLFGIWLMKYAKVQSPIVGMIVGIFLIQILTAIPFIGGIVGSFVFFVGVGAVVRMQYFKYKRATSR